MDESLQEHLKALEVGKLKLSEAIRIGKPLVDAQGEDRHTFRLCAMGCAFAGIRGRVMSRDEEFRFEAAGGVDGVSCGLAPALGVPLRLLVQVSDRHLRGESALSIASWLESQGL